MKFYLLLLTISISCFSDDISDYLNLIKTSEETPFIILEKKDFSWSNYPNGVEAKFINGLKAKKQLSEIGISKELSMLFSLLESGEISNKTCVRYCENIGYKTNSLMEAVYKRISSQGGLQLGLETYGNVAFTWLRHKEGDRVFNSIEIIYFWWNYDRKHVPEIWEKWYKCWQIENSREKPRDKILDRLAYDITRLGYYFFPYIYLAMKSGDMSLNALFSSSKPVIYKNVQSDFITWWEKNNEMYTLPEPKGWEHIDKMISTKNLPFGNWLLEKMPVWHIMAEEYYSKEGNSDNYWYYLIPNKDEVSDDEIWEANSKSIKVRD